MVSAFCTFEYQSSLPRYFDTFSSSESLPSFINRKASDAKNVLPVLPASMRCSVFIPEATVSCSPEGRMQLNAMEGISTACRTESIFC
jgi:hypothetical protein